MTAFTWTSGEIDTVLTQFDPATHARGLDYADRSMIVDYAVLSDYAVGNCLGTADVEYDCAVYVFTDSRGLPSVEGDCSCPVGIDCKHCVALLMTIQRDGSAAVTSGEGRQITTMPVPVSVQPAGPPEAWRTLLTELHELAQPGSTPSAHVPLGLLFDITEYHVVELRPLAPGKSKPWIMGRATWEHVFGLESDDDFSPAGLRALRTLADTLSPSLSRYYAPKTVTLSANAATWPTLEAACEAGVTFWARLPGITKLVPLELTYDVDARLSVERGPDGTTIGIELLYDDAVLDPSTSFVLGRASEGVVALVDRTVVLGPVPKLTGTEAAMLRDQRRILVPESAVPELSAALTDLPAGRAVEIGDDALTAQIIVGPDLRLVITCDESGSTVSWAMDYTVDEEPRSYASTDAARDPHLRNAPREQELFEDNRPELATVAALSSSWRGAARSVVNQAVNTASHAGDYASVKMFRELRDRVDTADSRIGFPTIPGAILAITHRLTFAETAILCAEHVPAIRAAGRVDVTIDGLPIDFRQPDVDPFIFFAGDAQTDWFDLTMTLDVDGHHVPVAAVIAALDAGEPFMVMPDGVYFPLDTPALQALRELLIEARELGELDSGKAAAGTFNVSLWEELLALGVVDEQLAAWKERIARLATARPPHPVDPPAGLRADLRQYQRDGLDWLSFLWDNRLGGILADDMGLGKTMQTLALMGRILAEQPDARFLVVAPTSVVGNWAAEAERFLPDAPVATITATQRRLGPLREVIGDARIVVTSYTLMRIDCDALCEFTWTAVVFDEAQFIKNHNAHTHKSARILPAEIKLAITGTPMENRVMELWALVSVVAPGLFSSPKTFKEHFAAPIENGLEPERLGILRRRLKPIMLRRTKGQVLTDLPEKQEQKLTLALEAKHRKIYDTHLARERQRMLGLLDDFDGNRIQILRALTAMRQLSLHPVLVDPQHAEVKSAKITYLAEQIPELIAEGHSALIFSSFTGFLKLVAARFDADGITYSYLDGTMSAKQRSAQIDQFMAGHTQVFLISLKAGGFGLNLTAADYCFVTDPWWNPAAESQAVDRAHRIGQKRAVTVYRMAAENTIEEKVIALQDRKRELFNALIDDGAQFSGAISADDIRTLLE